MTIDTSKTGGSRLARLKMDFVASLPARLAEAQRLAALMKNTAGEGVTTDALLTAFHNIKGVAKVFGMGDIGATASEGEQLVADRKAGTAVDEQAFAAALTACLKTLEQQCEIARSSVANGAPDSECSAVQGGATDTIPQARSGAPRILLVDDESILRNILKNVLRNEGYSVVGEAGDGVAALELCRGLKPDLVLLDINMPGVDGLDVLQAIRRYFPSIKVIMVSAYGSLDRVSSAISSGAVGFVVKPFNAASVIKQIERIFLH